MAVWSARRRVRRVGFPSSILGKFRAGFHLLGGFSNPGKQISSHERIEVAVEHPVHVSHLKLGAMVLHQLVGLKRVGADLAAEADPRLSLVELPSLFPALGELVLVQTRAKDLHGHLAVLYWLRSFWHCTTMPEERWVIRTAESVTLTCWPP